MASQNVSKVIDFASRFPPRHLEANILELAGGTIRIESGGVRFTPRGFEQVNWCRFVIPAKRLSPWTDGDGEELCCWELTVPGACG